MRRKSQDPDRGRLFVKLAEFFSTERGDLFFTVHLVREADLRVRAYFCASFYKVRQDYGHNLADGFLLTHRHQSLPPTFIDSCSARSNSASWHEVAAELLEPAFASFIKDTKAQIELFAEVSLGPVDDWWREWVGSNSTVPFLDLQLAEVICLDHLINLHQEFVYFSDKTNAFEASTVEEFPKDVKMRRFALPIYHSFVRSFGLANPQQLIRGATGMNMELVRKDFVRISGGLNG